MTMRQDLTKQELVAIVQRIMDADGTEEVLDRLQGQLEGNVLDLKVSDYIFWPPGGNEMTAEEIVDKALACRPLITPAPEQSD
jgi:hypothetical protein